MTQSQEKNFVGAPKVELGSASLSNTLNLWKKSQSFKLTGLILIFICIPLFIAREKRKVRLRVVIHYQLLVACLIVECLGEKQSMLNLGEKQGLLSLGEKQKC